MPEPFDTAMLVMAEIAELWQELDPLFLETARRLPAVPIFEIADSFLHLATEEARTRVSFRLDREISKMNFGIRVDWIRDQERRRYRGKPGPKELTDVELLELYRHFAASGLSQMTYCGRYQVSERQLRKAVKRFK